MVWANPLLLFQKPLPFQPTSNQEYCVHKGCGLLIVYNSPGKRYNKLFIFSTFFLWDSGHFTSYSAWSPPLSWIIHDCASVDGHKCKSCLQTCFSHCLSSHHVPQYPEEISQHLSLGCSVISIITRDTSKKSLFYHSCYVFCLSGRAPINLLRSLGHQPPFTPCLLSANFIMLC